MVLQDLLVGGLFHHREVDYGNTTVGTQFEAIEGPRKRLSLSLSGCPAEANGNSFEMENDSIPRKALKFQIRLPPKHKGVAHVRNRKKLLENVRRRGGSIFFYICSIYSLSHRTLLLSL